MIFTKIQNFLIPLTNLLVSCYSRPRFKTCLQHCLISLLIHFTCTCLPKTTHKWDYKLLWHHKPNHATSPNWLDHPRKPLKHHWERVGAKLHDPFDHWKYFRVSNKILFSPVKFGPNMKSYCNGLDLGLSQNHWVCRSGSHEKHLLTGGVDFIDWWLYRNNYSLPTIWVNGAFWNPFLSLRSNTDPVLQLSGD